MGNNMELLLDDNFKNAFEIYYGDLPQELVLESVNNVFNKYDSEILYDAVNVVKTARALGFTYTVCYEKITDTILARFPIGDDIEKFILSVTLKVLISAGAPSIAELVYNRDINKEVAAKYYKVPIKKVIEKMIENILEASEKFTSNSYSVDDPVAGSWDEYFYDLCRQVARNSKCLSRRIGAVLVYDKSIVSTGYNGPPRGVPRCDIRWKLDSGFVEKYSDKIKDKVSVEGQCPRYAIGFASGQGLEICPAGHAERNALINAARNGIKTRGTTLYMTCGIPCTPCLVEIINAGVKEIVVTSLSTYDDTSMYLLNQSDLGVRLFGFIK